MPRCCFVDENVIFLYWTVGRRADSSYDVFGERRMTDRDIRNTKV